MVASPHTVSFLLGSATVMVGTQDELWDMTPDANSVGLVQNFSFTTTPSFAELTQGIPKQLVYSVQTGETTKVTADLYEFTSRNLVYSLGQQPGSIAAVPAFYSSETALTGSDYTPVTKAFFTASSDVSASFTAGTWIMLQDINCQVDHVHYAQLTAGASVTGTAPVVLHMLTFANQGLRSGNDFPIGSLISPVNQVNMNIGGGNQNYVSVKVVGLMPYQNLPIVVVLPKARVTRGFTFTLAEKEFSKLPLEFAPQVLLPDDPFYSEFGGGINARVYVPAVWGGFPRFPDKNVIFPDSSRLLVGGRSLLVWR